MSVATLPPSYDASTVADLAKVAAKTTQDVTAISLLDQQAAGRALNTVMDSPENQKLMKDYIEKLCEKTLATRAAFEKISIMLMTFDSLKFKTQTNQPIGELRPGWDSLRLRYDQLLKKSHKDATTIKAVCDDYVEIVLAALDDPNMYIPDVQTELVAFIQRTKDAESRAESNATDFDTLRFDVTAFRKKIEDAFASATTDPEGRIPRLEGSIAQLKARIREQQAYIDRCLKAMVVAGIATGVTGVLAIFCPLAALFAIGSAIAAAGAANAARQTQQEMDANKAALAAQERELAILRQREQQLKNLQAELAGSAISFDTIITQLTALSNFWTSVQQDCRGAIDHLNNVLPSTTSAFTFKRTISNRLAGSVYIVLSQVLAVYVSQMTKLG